MLHMRAKMELGIIISLLILCADCSSSQNTTEIFSTFSDHSGSQSMQSASTNVHFASSTEIASTSSDYSKFQTVESVSGEVRNIASTTEISEIASTSSEFSTVESVSGKVRNIESTAEISEIASTSSEFSTVESVSGKVRNIESTAEISARSGDYSDFQTMESVSTTVGDISSTAQISSSDYFESSQLKSELTSIDSYQENTVSSSTVSEMSDYWQSSTFITEAATSSSTTPDPCDVMDRSMQLSVGNVTSRSFFVQWKEPNCTPFNFLKKYILTIKRLKILGQKNCQEENQILSLPFQRNETNFLFTMGYPHRKYLVTVHAELTTGTNVSVKKTVVTLESVPGAPLNLTITDVSAVSFVVRWEEPVCTFGSIKQYVIKIKYFKSAVSKKCYHGDEKYAFTINTTETSINFTHAKPYSNYEISVSAETAVGVGKSVDTIATTAKNVPEAPRNLLIRNITTSSFFVIWESPLCIHGPLKHYIVTIEYLGNCSSEVKNYPKIYQLNETYINFTGTKPYSNYNVIILAETETGKGASVNMTVTTQEEGPDPPQNLKIDNITYKSFLISWESTPCDNSPVEKYKVEVKYLGPVESDSDDTCRPASLFIHEYSIVPPEMEYNFTDGFRLSRYNVSVTSINNGSESNKRFQEVITSTLVPDDPKDLSVNSSNFNIRWSALRCVPGLIGYNINITLISPQQKCGTPMEKYMVNGTSFTFQNAVGNSKYEVFVAANTKYGEGKAANKTVTILPTVSSKVINLNVTPISSSSALAEWKDPCPINDVIQCFRVTIDLLPSLSKNVCDVILPEGNSCIKSNSFTINNLQANLHYKLTVTVKGANTGYGDLEYFLFQQPPSAPSEVRNLTITIVNTTSAVGQWHIPCLPNDEIIFYRVILGIPENMTEEKLCNTNIFHNGNYTFVNDTFIPMNNLTADCQYILNVSAVGTHTGDGDSVNASFRQPSGVPELNADCDNCLVADPFKTENPTKEILIGLEANLFSKVNGKILYYAILVNLNDIGMESESNYLKGALSTDCSEESWKITGLNSYGDWEKNKTVPYQATPNCWTAFSENINLTQFCLGDGSRFGYSIYNAPLKAGTKYVVKVRAFTSHGYQDTGVIHIETDTDTSLALTIGLVFGFLVVGVIGVVIVMQRSGQLPRMMRFWGGRNTPQQVHPRAVALKRFPEYCSYLLDIPGRLSSEFQLLASLSVDIKNTNSFNAGLLPDNKFKNRYVNIIPYDLNRVKLDIEGDDLSSDYINASFVNGYSQKVEYIACQGPKEDTIYDFWRMVYQSGVKIIVMVTQLEEQGKVKCCQYYPNLWETMSFNEDISVRCTTELCFPIYTSRTFILQKGGKKRMIVHLHFREWPDFGCPVTTEVMLLFCQTVRYQVMLSSPGLVVVHCSAGVGRTGTLIAVDILLQHIRENKSVDIFGVVYALRKQRVNMVQTEGQYGYIYRCIKDALLQPSYLKQEKVVRSSAEPIYENITPKFKSPKGKTNSLESECEL